VKVLEVKYARFCMRGNEIQYSSGGEGTAYG
jgi:hypothetical protein